MAKRAANLRLRFSFLLVRGGKRGSLEQSRGIASWTTYELKGKTHPEEASGSLNVYAYILLWQMSEMTLDTPFTPLASVSPHKISTYTIPECPHGIICFGNATILTPVTHQSVPAAVIYESRLEHF